MPITLITGPVGSGRTTLLFEKLSDALAKGKAVYIAPNETLATELRTAFLSFLEESGKRAALVGDIFLSLRSFVYRLTQKTPTMTSFQQTLLCFELLQSQQLRYFDPHHISFQIARDAASSIHTLKKNGISPEQLEVLLETRGSLQEYDLLTLFKRYETKREDLHLLDEGDLFQRACSLSYTGEIFVDEFTHLQPGERTLFQNLAAQTHMHLTLPEADDEHQPFASFLKKSISTLQPLTHTHQQLPKKNHEMAQTTLLSLRSSLDETRFCLQQLLGTEDESFSPAMIVTRQRSAFPKILFQEWKNVQNPERAPAPVSRIFSEILQISLPEEASLLTFAEQLRKSLQPTHSDPSLHLRFLHLLQTLSAQAHLLQLKTFSRTEFYEIIQFHLEQENIHQPQLPFETRSFERSISQPHPRIIIPEMNEGNIPFLAPEHFFFSDQLDFSASPNPLLDEIFPAADQLLALDAFRFYTFLTKATEEVVLTFSLLDHKGQETIPSSFVKNFGPPLPIESQVFSPEALQTLGTEALLQRITIEQERRAMRKDHLSYHGLIQDPEARKLLKERFTQECFSPSRLETYAECPMRFFFEKVLGLKPEEEITPEVQPKDRGTIIHALLECFYRDYRNLFSAALTDASKEKEISALLDQLLDEVFLQHDHLLQQSAPALRPFERKAIRKVIEKTLFLELETARALSTPLLPSHCEWIFGTEHVKPLSLSLENDDDILIQGRVDRIDVSHDGSSFLIVDYKTGKSIESIRKKIEDGLHLQIPLYIAAVQKLLLPHASALGGLLFAVMKGEKTSGMLKKEHNEKSFSLSSRSRALISEEEWEDLLETSFKYTRDYVTAIRNGNFSHLTSEPCKYCTFAQACRRGTS